MDRRFFQRATRMVTLRPTWPLALPVPMLLGLVAVWALLVEVGANQATLAQVESRIAISDYPVFAYPGQPVTVTVAWENIPTDGRYKLRIQLENKMEEPHVYYFPPDVTGYNAAETRTVTFTIPTDAEPRVGSRFVVAFISTTVDWDDVLIADFGPADVTIESDPPSGWTSGRFRLAGPDAGSFFDPEGRLFYVRGMTYAYGPETITTPLTAADVISELARMKDMGFNTVNLYPRHDFNTDTALQTDFLPEILSWADHNRMAVYARIWYSDKPEFPDYMDRQYRQQAKHSLDAVLKLARSHPSLLAVDLDHRWLFDVDWPGARRFGTPHLMTHTLAYLPTWLEGHFGTVDALNKAWGKDYFTFTQVLSDPEIVRDGQVVDLARQPWRVELVEYALWVMEDFMAEIIAYAHYTDPDHLYTYTNDRAEVIPFPISSRASSGIDFISPVHYNAESDFYRDWMAQAKLTHETLWQRDLYDLVPFVRESGWRTEVLSQTLPNTGYAWSLTETHKAELYLRQATLMAVYPWIPGWAYFKWYDKYEEGNFGYLKDDGTLRPIAELGHCINQDVPVNLTGRQSPRLWVYYPTYALAAPYPAFEHYKTLVKLLAHDFFSAYEERAAETWSQVTWPLTDCAAITNTRLFTDLADVFAELWPPFAFTSTVPTDDRPILLAGRALEPLSQADCDALAEKRTVTFGPVGDSDERYHRITPWYAEVAGLTLPSDTVTIAPTWPSTEPAIHILSYPITAYACRSADVAVAWQNLSTEDVQDYKLIVQFENWDVSPGVLYMREFTDFDTDGSLTVTLDISQQVLTYTQAITGARYVAAFISRTTGWTDTLAVTATLKTVAIQTSRWVTVTAGDLACPAWTAWTVRPLTGTYRTLATFQGEELDGQPAVVQSWDGRHTAFLYDVLLWKPIAFDSERQQIEEGLACHYRLLNSLPGFYVYLPLLLKGG